MMEAFHLADAVQTELEGGGSISRATGSRRRFQKRTGSGGGGAGAARFRLGEDPVAMADSVKSRAETIA